MKGPGCRFGLLGQVLGFGVSRVYGSLTEDSNIMLQWWKRVCANSHVFFLLVAQNMICGPGRKNSKGVCSGFWACCSRLRRFALFLLLLRSAEFHPVCYYRGRNNYQCCGLRLLRIYMILGV